MSIGHKSFFQVALGNWVKVDRWSAIMCFLTSAFGASLDLLGWAKAFDHASFGRIGAGVDVLLSFLSIYILASSVIQRSPTLLGAMRFLVVAALLFFPLFATFGLLFAVKPYLAAGWRVTILMVGILIWFFGAAFLPAWPLAQAQRSKPVSPVALFHATKGYRGGLFLMTFVISGINRADFVPSITTANNVGEASLIALGQALVGFFSIVIMGSVAATSWQFAVRENPALL